MDLSDGHKYCRVSVNYLGNLLENSQESSASAISSPTPTKISWSSFNNIRSIQKTFGQCFYEPTINETICIRNCIGNQCNNNLVSPSSKCIQCQAYSNSLDFLNCLHAEASSFSEINYGFCESYQNYCVTQIHYESESNLPTAVFRGCFGEDYEGQKYLIENVQSENPGKDRDFSYNCFNLEKNLQNSEKSNSNANLICHAICQTKNPNGPPCNDQILENYKYVEPTSAVVTTTQRSAVQAQIPNNLDQFIDAMNDLKAGRQLEEQNRDLNLDSLTFKSNPVNDTNLSQKNLFNCVMLMLWMFVC